MGSPVETTLKALVEFESELDGMKVESLEAKQKMLKDAQSLAESAMKQAVSKAQEIASERLAKAKAEAENEAASIRKKGESALKGYEASISKKKAKAAETVVARLLGEAQ